MKRQKSEPQTRPDRRNGAGHFQVGTWANFPGGGSTTILWRHTLVASFTFVLLMVQPLWGFQTVITFGGYPEVPTKQKIVFRFQMELTGGITGQPGGFEGPEFPLPGQFSDNVLLAEDAWEFQVGLEADDFDYNTDGQNIVYFDGIDSLKVKLKGRHKEVPPGHSGEVAHDLPTIFSRAKSRNDDDGVLRFDFQESVDHGSHRDRYGIKVEFGVKPQSQDSVVGFGDVILSNPVFGPNAVVTGTHLGLGSKLAMGRTMGTTDVAMNYNSGSQELFLGLSGINILSTPPTTTAVIDPEYAGDSLASTASPPMLPSIAAAYTGFNNGVYSFTPVSYFPGADQFPIQTATGDSDFVGTWDTLNIDPVTGEAQGHLTTISYTERSGAAGDDPSIFMGDFLDEHLHDNNLDRDGLVFTFDATALLNGSNNFTNNYDSFSSGDQTALTISGAVIVPESTTLVLLSIGMLLVGLRRGAGHREQGR